MIKKRPQPKGQRRAKAPLDPQAGVKQEIFVREYLIDFNATRAAKAAGYSDKTAYSIGHELLKKPEIQTMLADRISARCERLEITSDRILQEIAKCAFSNMKDYVAWGPSGLKIRPADEVSEIQSAAIAEFSETTSQFGGSLKFKLYPKLQALELLGRHKDLAMWRDKLQVDPGGPASEEFERTVQEVKFLMLQARRDRGAG